ncbi:MAG: transcriptional regulator [Acidobacteria bacterium]|jgi:HTH-type transcriptional regulator/antitoxin HigA|nr:transcriptional regulator [Acidobacteriota bacterium]
MTGTIDNTKYAEILATALPRKIETEEENERVLKIVENLMSKGEDNLSPEEETLLVLLAELVEDFEKKAYPEVGSSSTPRDVLAFLMEQQGLKQKDLVDIFSSSGTISQVLNGAREISKAQAKALAERFKVSAELFI